MSARPRGFASDNYAGVLPEVMEAIERANRGHASSYGNDDWTARVEELFKRELGDDATAAIVFNGTGANVVAMQALTRPYEAAICASTAHLNVDECGAPERVAGIKLLTLDTPDGKITPELVEPRLVRFGDEHAVQPRVVSITQSTELGTLYTPDEIRALADQAHERGMLLHLDGARLANAAAALNLPLRALTTDVGVDAWRRSVAWVPQRPYLFDASVADNVRLGVPDADDDAVRAAVTLAEAHDVVAALPDGYDTRLGERGARLSAGQRQRIALARAFLRRLDGASLVLLDEPTAHLDPESAAAVRAGVARLLDGATGIVVAHDAGWADLADDVVRLEAGRVVRGADGRAQAAGRAGAGRQQGDTADVPGTTGAIR